eukprot:tig00000743_g3861.t1
MAQHELAQHGESTAAECSEAVRCGSGSCSSCESSAVSTGAPAAEAAATCPVSQLADHLETTEQGRLLLNELWRGIHAESSKDSSKQDGLDYDRYCRAHFAVQKAVFVGRISIQQAANRAKQDWRHDSAGNNSVSRACFLRSVLSIAAQRALGVCSEPEQLVSSAIYFLHQLVEVLTVERAGARRLRSTQEISEGQWTLLTASGARVGGFLDSLAPGAEEREAACAPAAAPTASRRPRRRAFAPLVERELHWLALGNRLSGRSGRCDGGR